MLQSVSASYTVGRIYIYSLHIIKQGAANFFTVCRQSSCTAVCAQTAFNTEAFEKFVLFG